MPCALNDSQSQVSGTLEAHSSLCQLPMWALFVLAPRSEDLMNPGDWENTALPFASIHIYMLQAHQPGILAIHGTCILCWQAAAPEWAWSRCLLQSHPCLAAPNASLLICMLSKEPGRYGSSAVIRLCFNTFNC